MSSKIPSDSEGQDNNQQPVLFMDTLELNGKERNSTRTQEKQESEFAVDEQQIRKPQKIYVFKKLDSQQPTQSILSSIDASQLSKGATQVVENEEDPPIVIEAEGDSIMPFDFNNVTNPFDKTADTSTPNHTSVNFIEETPSDGKTIASKNIFKMLADKANNLDYGQVEGDSMTGIVLGEIDRDPEDMENSRPDDSYLPVNLKVGSRKNIDESYSMRNYDQYSIYLNDHTQADGNVNREVNEELRQMEQHEQDNDNDNENTREIWKQDKADDTQLSNIENNDKTYDQTRDSSVLILSDKTPLNKAIEDISKQHKADVQVPGSNEKAFEHRNGYESTSESPLLRRSKSLVLNKSQQMSMVKSLPKINENDTLDIYSDHEGIVVSDSDIEDDDNSKRVDSAGNHITQKSFEIVSSQGSLAGTQTQHIEPVGTFTIGTAGSLEMQDIKPSSDSDIITPVDNRQGKNSLKLDYNDAKRATGSPIFNQIASQEVSELDETVMGGNPSAVNADEQYSDEAIPSTAKRRKVEIILSASQTSTGKSQSQEGKFLSGELKGTTQPIMEQDTQSVYGVSQLPESAYEMKSTGEMDENGEGKNALHELANGVGKLIFSKSELGDNLEYRSIPDTAVIPENDSSSPFTFPREKELGSSLSASNEAERMEVDNVSDEPSDLNGEEEEIEFTEENIKLKNSVWISNPKSRSKVAGFIKEIIYSDEMETIGSNSNPSELSDTKSQVIQSLLNIKNFQDVDLDNFRVKLENEKEELIDCRLIHAPLYIMIGTEMKRLSNKKQKYEVIGLSYNPEITGIRCSRGYNCVRLVESTKTAKEHLAELKDLYLTIPMASKLVYLPFDNELNLKRFIFELFIENFRGLGGEEEEIQYQLSAPPVRKSLPFKDTDQQYQQTFSENNTNKGNLLFSGCIFCITSQTVEEEARLQTIIKKHGGAVVDDFMNIIKVNLNPTNNELQLDTIHLLNRDAAITKIWEHNFPIIIASEPVRTLKYLQALAFGWPVVSAEFVYDCDDGICDFQNWGSYLLPAGKSFFRNSTTSTSQNMQKFISNMTKHEIISLVDSKGEQPPPFSLMEQLELNQDVLENYDVVVLGTNKRNSFPKLFFYGLGIRKIKYINEVSQLDKEDGFTFFLDQIISHSSTSRNCCIYTPDFKQFTQDRDRDRDNEGDPIEAELNFSNEAINEVLNKLAKLKHWERSLSVLAANGISDIKIISKEWLVQCIVVSQARIPLISWDISIYADDGNANGDGKSQNTRFHPIGSGSVDIKDGVSSSRTSSPQKKRLRHSMY